MSDENETPQESEAAPEAADPAVAAAAAEDGGMNLEDLGEMQEAGAFGDDDDGTARSATNLEPVFDVPVTVQAVLGKSSLEVSQLLKLGPGAIVELDRKVGEAIDIYVNDRLVARGEVVLVEDHLGVTMTEIIKTE